MQAKQQLTIEIITPEQCEQSYRGWTIRMAYANDHENDSHGWLGILVDDRGEQINEPKPFDVYPTIEDAIDWAQEQIDVEACKRSFAPRFLEIINQAKAQNFSQESIDAAIEQANRQDSEA